MKALPRGPAVVTRSTQIQRRYSLILMHLCPGYAKSGETRPMDPILASSLYRRLEVCDVSTVNKVYSLGLNQSKLDEQLRREKLHGLDEPML
jgi:hypothetical protein